MAKKENIVSYSAEEIAAMVARGEDKTDWARANAKTEEQLAADTASDPAWDGVPDDWHNDAVARTGPLFRPRENKQPVHIRFDADVVAFFKRGGRGWQGRMNAVLRSFMERRHG